MSKPNPGRLLSGIPESTDTIVPLIGSPDHVRNVIDVHRRAGTLVAMTAPRPVSATDARVRVAVRLRTITPVSVPPLVMIEPGSYRPLWRAIGLVLATTTAVVGLGYLILYTAAAIAGLIADHLAVIIGALAVAVTLLGLLLGRASSGKRHCPGC